ncbi:hypothetical protein DPEC_G00067700 [Dallia pectoralis]|uniref:Uncharacterized protein n=1 Tax=Dallia pectoralis TaxID=75939 RepID=A0ACC2H2M3_DALPE|nr:hypothetical protein DPEC_G00067700 [Dallia pectoralis]
MFLRLSSDSAENRSSSIDKAPYSLRKSVRLPNCDKEDSGFDLRGSSELDKVPEVFDQARSVDKAKLGDWHLSGVSL